MAATKPVWPQVLEELDAPRHQSLSQQSHETLYQAILQGRVPPGSHLPEEPIARTLGVSRISIREAIRELTREGLVEIIPNRGAYTVEFGPSDIEEIFSLRAALEGLAIRLAAQNAGRTDIARLEDVIEEMEAVQGSNDRLAGARVDAMFHRVMVEASGHSRVLQVWHGMSAQITMAVYNSTTYYQDIDGLPDRHQGILDIIRQGDPDAAEECIKEHIFEGGRLLLEAVGRDRVLNSQRAGRPAEEEVQ